MPSLSQVTGTINCPLDPWAMASGRWEKFGVEASRTPTKLYKHGVCFLLGKKGGIITSSHVCCSKCDVRIYSVQQGTSKGSKVLPLSIIIISMPPRNPARICDSTGAGPERKVPRRGLGERDLAVV